MKSKNPFSIIELMTVVLIVLLLISLTIPIFVNLKMNARTAICKGQLRQMGVLLTSYASAYNGYLPNDNAGGPDYNGGGTKFRSDLGPGKFSSQNNELYKNWNGHLLPFFDTPIKSWVRATKVSIDGNVRWQEIDNPFNSSARIDISNDPLKNGWAIINDAYRKGGYGDLKTFICPEIHNTYDVRAHNVANGLEFPRMKLSDARGFPRNVGDYLGDGTPTTYMANDYFFGQDGDWGQQHDSLRIDDLADISHKALIIEGGMCYGGGRFDGIYFNSGLLTLESDLLVNAYDNRFNRGGGGTKTSFVHDGQKQFWTSLVVNQPAYYCNQSVVADFNTSFEGRAYMIPNAPNKGSGYIFISFIDDINGTQIKNWLIAKEKAEPNKFPGPLVWPGKNAPLKFELYDEPENSYLAGNMNILFGDNSVSIKNQGWLYNNRDKVAKKTAE